MSSPDPDATVRALGAGMRVFGRYKLESIAGRGGMGVVWKARDEELERTVALKFLPEFVAADPEAARDLKRETKRCLELTHVNIVRVFDFLTDGRDAAIAMEFVEGESLATRKANAPGGCLGVDEVAPLARQLCQALAYAHSEAKIVHRDLKPANLLVTKDGKLKVTDFGIARSLSESQTRLTGRAVAGTSGTLLYISPQQLGGDKPSPADDLYAVGATLYELLTGKPPFYRGDAFSLMKQVAERAPTPLEEHRADAGCEGPPIPPAWNDTVLACLAKNAPDRPASAEEILRRLSAAETLPPTAPLPKPPPVAPPVAARPAAPEPPPQPAPPAAPPPPPLAPPKAKNPTGPLPVPPRAAPAPIADRPAPEVAPKPPAPAPPPTPAPVPAPKIAREPEPAAPAYVPPPLPPEWPEDRDLRHHAPQPKNTARRYLLIAAAVLAVVTGVVWVVHVNEEHSRVAAARQAQDTDYQTLRATLDDPTDAAAQQMSAAMLSRRIADLDAKVQTYLDAAPARYRADMQAAWLTRKLALQDILQRSERAAAAEQAKRDRDEMAHQNILRRIASAEDDAPASLVNAVERDVAAYAAATTPIQAAAVRTAWNQRKAAWDRAEQKRRDTQEAEKNRQKRAQDDAVAEAQRRARVGALMDSARAADRPESAEQALQLLAQVLELEPNNAAAIALRKKVQGYPRILKVPGQHATLTEALKAAKAGDTIELAAGVYKEDPPKITGAVTIRGAGIEATIVQQPAMAASDLGPAFWIACKEGTVQLTDLTIETIARSEAERRHPLVSVDGSRAELLRVRVRNGAGSGLGVDTLSSVRAVQCRFEGNAWSGASVGTKGTTGTFESCTFENNRMHGLHVAAGGNLEVTNSTSRRNGWCGFAAFGAATATLRGNVASENKQNGFAITEEGTTATLIDNEARGGGENYPNVVVTTGARVTCRNNRAFDGADAGFLLRGGASGTFEKDESRGNTGCGFQLLEKATARFTGTVARNNRLSGYALSGSGTRATLSGIVASDNTGNGIYARETSSATASGVTITSNKMVGVYCEDDSRIDLQGTNRIESNGPNGTDNIRLPAAITAPAPR